MLFAFCSFKQLRISINYMSKENLLMAAIEAAEQAGKEILEVYNSDDFQTQLKEDNSPLTIADTRAHDRIVEVLRQHSSFPILSEEGKDIPYSERRDWERFWLVDPLDGTKEFIKRNGEFTVNIALIEKNVPVLGVVGVPVKGELYYAVTGRGAFMQISGKVTALPKRTPADLKKSGLRVVASRSHMNEDTHRYIDSLNQPLLISAGSSLKFMAVAKGEADLYPRYIPCMEWDTAAADVIVREVGLATINIETRRPLEYNKEDLRTPYFVCG